MFKLTAGRIRHGVLAVLIACMYSVAQANGPTFAAAVAAQERGDFATLIKILRPLAESGNRDAQYLLGSRYESGRGGVPQDYREAISWYQKAAEQGDADAQYALGGMHYLGRGMPENWLFAHTLFNLAAAQGHEGAALHRDVVSRKLTRAQVDKAQTLARRWRVGQPLPTRATN